MSPVNFSIDTLVELLQYSASFYLVKVSPDGTYTYLNDNFLNRHSAYYKRGHIDSALMAVHPDDYHLCAKTYQLCITNPDEVFSVNLRKLDGKGGFIHTYWEYKALFSAVGEIDGVVGIGYDITASEARKDHIRHLTTTLNNLANQQSHLVRRPLANVMGLVEVLDQLETNDEGMKNIVTMLRQSCNELNDEFEVFMTKGAPGHPDVNAKH